MSLGSIGAQAGSQQLRCSWRSWEQTPLPQLLGGLGREARIPVMKMSELSSGFVDLPSTSLRKQGLVTVVCERTLVGLELRLSGWECGCCLAHTRPWVQLSALEEKNHK